MKRLLVTILTMLYLGTSTGATIHLHYCMGKLVSMKLWHSDKDKCRNCGMKKSTGYTKKCCKDEHKLIKLEKDQRKADENTLLVALFVAETPPAYIEIKQGFAPSIAEDQPVSHAPPLSIRIHILHCIFLV